MPTPINLSASRGAAIMGLSKWQTPVSVWLQIMEAREPGFCASHNYELPVVEDNPSMRWGRAFESAIIELAERKQNWNIINRELLFNAEHKDMEYVTCHIDGMYDFGRSRDFRDGDLTLHEGKTASDFYYREHFGEPGTDKVPIEYQIQCQHQMLCTGAEKVILSVLVFPSRPEEWEEMGWEVLNDKLSNKNIEYQMNCISSWAYTLDQMGYFHQYHVPAHHELQRLMLEKYTAWWERYVIGRTPPEIESYDDVKALCPQASGTLIADERIERLASEYKNITEEIGTSGSLHKRKEQIRVEILKYMIDLDKKVETIKDDDSIDRFILRARDGKKLFSYDGKALR